MYLHLVNLVSGHMHCMYLDPRLHQPCRHSGINRNNMKRNNGIQTIIGIGIGNNASSGNTNVKIARAHQTPHKLSPRRSINLPFCMKQMSITMNHLLLLLAVVTAPVFVNTQLIYEFTTASEWTLVSGSRLNQTKSYGDKNVTLPSNAPGSRVDHTMAVDSNSGMVYLFGGGTGFRKCLLPIRYYHIIGIVSN